LKIEKVVDQLRPLPRWAKKVFELWSTNEKVIDVSMTHRSAHFSGYCSSALKFLHELEIDQGYLAHTPIGTGVYPQNFNRENLKFGLKFSVYTSISSELMGLSS